MSAKIQLQNPRNRPLEEARLTQAALAALDQTDARRCASLSIVVTDADALRAFNRQHRQVDAATDVLSFAAAPLPAAIDAAVDYLGDIVIAYDYVAAQCDARGCCLGDTLCLLVVHGTLHLLGHDHECAASRERMWGLQEATLKSLGISPALVHNYAAAGDG
ncbi:MAG: rRNA maturation RNase YbeY [Anaerolineae bacterium]|nr:rRNA maturation RNase YbeY [Anaerolineae bacterium]